MESCEQLRARGGWWEDLLGGRCAFPIGPVNTFSNLAYVFAGVAAAALVPSWAGVVFGAAMVFLGIGSALYHGTKRVWASRLDNAGMYAAFATLVAYAVSPAHPLVPVAMTAFGALCAWKLAYGANWKILLDPMMGIMIGVSTIAVMLNGSLRSALISLGLFMAAYGIWWMDKKRSFWFPRWGHGLWHIITAGAMLKLFLGVIP